MSSFSDWKKLQQQRLEERPLGEKIMGAGMGAAETALSLATSFPATAVAGLEGIGRSVAGQPLPEVVDAIKSREEQLTYAPRSPEGRQYMGAIEEYIGQPYEDIKKSMGGTSIERGLGPEVATASHMMPDVALMLATLGLGNILTRGGRLKYRDVSGNWMPTPMLENALRDRGLTFESLNPSTIAKIPEELPPMFGSQSVGLGLTTKSRTGLVGESALESEADIGGRQSALAPYKVGQGLTKDPIAQSALKQGVPPNIVRMITTADPVSRIGFERMAKNIETYRADASNANDKRPLNIVGDSIGTRLIDLRKVANDRRVKLEQVVNKDLSNKFISPNKVYTNLISKLDEYNIKMDRDKSGKLYFDFSESDVKLDPQSQRLINSLLDALPDGEMITGTKAHQIKKQLDGLINYEKISVGDVTPQGKSFLMSIRSGLNDSIRDVSKEYASLNDDLSVILDAFSQMQELAGKKIDMFDPETNAKSLGLLSRKLVTNYASQPLLEQAIFDLQKAADKFGLERGDNLTDLVTFANWLEKEYGTPVSGGFQAKNEAANERLVEAVQNPSWESAVAGAYKYGRDKIRGVNDENAFKAIYELIRKGGK